MNSNALRPQISVMTTSSGRLDKKALLALAAAFSVTTVLSVLLLDQGLAQWLHTAGLEGLALFDQGTAMLDVVSGKEISKFLLGFVLLAAGVLLSLFTRTRRGGHGVLYVGAVQLLSTLIAGVSKNAFGRLRPYELLQNDAWDAAWQVGGSAFPSGHAAFYFGLFLPLAYLLPRWRWPLMIIPVFIGLARVNANDHFLSDVTASFALVALLAWAGAACFGSRLLRR